jgi:hypothetical protein
VPSDRSPAAPSTPASPSPPGYQLGKPAQADNGQVTAIVYEYRQPAAPGGPDGSAWGGADVQVCVPGNAIFDVSVSRGPWLLLSREGHTITASLATDGGLPQPAYPTDHRRLRAGECVRGWIGFAVPPADHPVAVQYAPSGAQPINWAIR